MNAGDVLGQLAGAMVGNVLEAAVRTIRESALSAEQQEAALDVLGGELVAAVGRVQARKFKVLPDENPTAPGGG